MLSYIITPSLTDTMDSPDLPTVLTVWVPVKGNKLDIAEEDNYWQDRLRYVWDPYIEVTVRLFGIIKAFHQTEL